jgi:hypothetical protein
MKRVLKTSSEIAKKIFERRVDKPKANSSIRDPNDGNAAGTRETVAVTEVATTVCE